MSQESLPTAYESTTPEYLVTSFPENIQKFVLTSLCIPRTIGDNLYVPLIFEDFSNIIDDDEILDTLNCIIQPAYLALNSFVWNNSLFLDKLYIPEEVALDNVQFTKDVKISPSVEASKYIQLSNITTKKKNRDSSVSSNKITFL